MEWNNIIKFLHKVGDLKEIKRSGWIRKGIINPESVAEHSFRTAILALVLADKFNVDKDKCIKMGLMHDITESIVGDITPHDNVSKEEKNKREMEAINVLTQDLNNEIKDLWIEFEEKKTPESIFVNQLDKIEMIFQAIEYEKRNKNINFDEFWEYTRKNIKDNKLEELYNLLLMKRKLI